MSDIDSKLSEEFDLPIDNSSMMKQIMEPKEIVAVTPQTDLEKDYTDIRRNIKNIISKGSEAIDGILNLASETESPRAYEVLSQMIKTVSDANKDLLEIHKKMKDIEGVSTQNQNASTITNNSIFVGSTSDLQNILRGKMKELDTLGDE
jgi:hypothetical protein